MSAFLYRLGRISARHVVVERKADIHCFRTVRAEHIEIKGRMSGEIITQSVTVHRKGSLEGDVTARAISVERSGMFSGQLAIGQVGLAPTAFRAQRPQPVFHQHPPPASPIVSLL